MSKKTGILKGLSGVQAAISVDVAVWAAIRMEHIQRPDRKLSEIARSARRILAVTTVPVSTMIRTYYRLEASFLNEEIKEQ